MKIINTENAPAAIGPYSQAIKVGDFIYCSGQIGLEKSGDQRKLVGGVKNQTHQICKNINEILSSEGLSLNNVIKNTIFLENIDDFQLVNEIYEQYFSHKPARSTVEVSKLPKGAYIEIESIAYTGKKL